MSNTLQPEWGTPGYPVVGKDMLIDETHAIMSGWTFNRLPEYSCSMPSGVVPGKTWKRAKNYYDRSAGWLICRYDPKDEYTVTPYAREVLILEDPQ